ncbi:MAG: SIS domain-containing protein [bacterium]|nr:SIS domain-containing protein [bacterium]
MFDDAIKSFPKQFEYEPEIVNADKLKKFSNFVVVGMGGSCLAAKILKDIKPSLNIIIHSDYDLPTIGKKFLEESLIILSSYSGNTEEVLSAYDATVAGGLSLAVVSTGGKLLEKAKMDNAPYVQMPDTGIQPRLALGFSIKALLKIMGEETLSREMNELSKTLKSEDLKEPARELAERLLGFIPVIYSSSRNFSLAYIWKIIFNETSKIPAFYNVFPELNHNELEGFDVVENTEQLSEKFYFLILKDTEDNPRIAKRMDVLAELYKDKRLKVETLELRGQNIFHKFFTSILLAEWTAYYLAGKYVVDPGKTMLIEKFKKLIN